MPTPRERELLVALSETARALWSYNAELGVEVERVRAERLVVASGVREQLHTYLPLKSERQRSLERAKRDAKSAAMACINALAQGRMYSEAQICRVAATDGSVDRLGILRPAQRAIAQVDVEEALGWINNDYARRAFWLRFKWGQDNDRVSEALGCRPEDVNRLVNIALDFVSGRLNAPVVADIRARFFNFCLSHGLDFPEYEMLRRREGKQ